jgi:hypothetical protein
MIDLDALKAAGLNSRENSERLLAAHRETPAQTATERTADDWVLMRGRRWMTSPTSNNSRGRTA